MTRTPIIRALVAGAALALLAGCSGGGAGDESASDTPPGDDGQSTFAVDIDTASYDYTARQLEGGRLPDPAEVRPEEFVNAFHQDYPEPAGDGITVSGDGTRPPAWYDSSPNARIMRVGLKTKAEAEGERPPAALTFVVDVSGSMRDPGKLDLVQDALHHLVDELRESDSVALVAYSESAEVLREMTPVKDREVLHEAVDALSTDSATDLEEGLVTGYEVARRAFVAGAVNRVILLSDGLANTGSTTAGAILEQVATEASDGIALLCVGVGTEYGDALMEQLADNGDGFAVYVSKEEQARELFVTRLAATLTVRARDVKVQVTFDEENVESYRLIGFENRAVADQDFRDDSVDGGEMGPGHAVTALYELVLREGASGSVAAVSVRWLSPADRGSEEVAATVGVADLDRDWASAAPRLRVSLVAGAFAKVLRGDGGRAWLPSLEEDAGALFAATEDAQVKRLGELIAKARKLG
ncbi:von Willebrand factor type A domain-containing protein [Phytomonospora sp. NPDC050363]|uniref:vWA domain-containing protein n=1 Tax=Phytomonospora sp. NPDC050363 TaxID=3155642 RepID=UPI00340F65B3